MDAPHDAQHQPPQEDVPVGPGESDEVNDNPPQLEPVAVPIIHQPEYRPLNEPRIQRNESENIELMHSKLNRILGRTDEIQSIKYRIGSISGLLHIVDQRTIEMKDILDRTIDGLEQVYHQ
uniref:Biogenesis of lysosome-related organelles complex 1 subunit CNL1 n=1 Tax=Haemonchus contortus TaxID=6289 RepID=A0A7I5ECL5_HAECO